MLKKINRITKRKEFELIRTEGKIYQSPLFGLAVIKEENKEKKFGMIVSKKIAKKAVDRNKIRRRLAEVIKRNMKEIPDGVKAVVLAKMKLVEAKVDEIEIEFNRLIKEIK